MISKSKEQTKKIAEELIKKLDNAMPILLFGGLGSGKTVFVKGIAKALGISERTIKSPTYTYIREIDLTRSSGVSQNEAYNKKFYHLDLYRSEHSGHEHLEIEDIIKRGDWIIIEWAEHLKTNKPKKRIEVYFEMTGKNIRKIDIKTYG